MTAVPRVGVFDFTDATKVTSEVPLPGVFQSPIRQDLVQFVHTNLSKNSRQARGVDPLAGMRHAAISWGPGRAVARIPRVTGSGSQRTGQAAFGNMTRKGRMFAPLQTWRRWHRKVNVNQRRYALCSALAASAVTPLVMARGHRVSQLPSLPLVLDDNVQNVEKTKVMNKVMSTFGLDEDVNRCVRSKVLRAGKGKSRNRRYQMKVGPLVVYHERNCKLVQALANLPGVDSACVQALDLRQLAPGAHLGRLVVWTKSAFLALNNLYGTPRLSSTQKRGFTLQRSCLTNADVQRVINSNEVQSVLRDTRRPHRVHNKQKKNPLKNRRAMNTLNPFKPKNRVRNKQTKEQRKQNKQNSRKWMSKVQNKEQESQN